jgi:hypothetical protein
MTSATVQNPISIDLVALPETTPGTLYGLYEVFTAVGIAWSIVTGESTAACSNAVRV